ncbi:glycosyltransferase [Waterburya agarophytonicola K14]|uniref:cellulose synthase (UDP-forming) n=1 Tax=Waterburya agarophytonicola KI4 TaxID=2874699 RepID=A0A964BML9_9CYAN|nr:glycosyltransferase [Waterburya agarophytonicola KI4]
MQTIKPVSESNRGIYVKRKSSTRFSLHFATLGILSVLGFLGAIAVSWLLGNSHVTELFIQLHLIQANPPSWLMPPEVSNKYYLLAPTVILLVLAQVVMKLSPEPTTWSRRLVAMTLFALFLRYFFWRSLSSLNLATPVEGIFSLMLFLMELLAMGGGALQLLLLLTVKNRDREAEKYSVAVKENSYNPSVDILIPTYNEPDFILKRTIIGCQAINYDNKQVYILDDTRRQSVKQLAQELGCHYITRSDNFGAKAGNLNNALKKTSGELVVVFDADFVPTTNFLERTVGFFQKDKIALVQTPQSFYNSDPIAHNLGLQEVLTSEEEVFYRHLQPIKDGTGSVVCAGTSFVARRNALREIGYFATQSVSEDYFTGIQLSARGYELVYLDEKLSAGLAAESIGAHIEQRLRWVRGTLQAFFIKSNPLTIPGLNLWQRLGHLEGIFHWFTCIPRVFFLIVPVICIFGQLNPVLSSSSEMVYIFLPYYMMQLTMFSWLNKRSRSVLLSDVYSLIQAIPVFVTVFKVMFSPFGKGFKVTPKGLSRDKFNYNWSLALPMTILFGATMVSFSVSLLNPPSTSFNLGLYWSSYNLLTISVAMITLLDLPKPSFYEWFTIKKEIDVYSDRSTYQSVTQKISEEGVEIILERSADLSTDVFVELLPEVLIVSGKVTRSYLENDYLIVTIKFNQLNLEQHRELVEMLYCVPGRWQKRNTPNELQSIFILFKLVLRPLMFLNSKKVSKLKLQY